MMEKEKLWNNSSTIFYFQFQGLISKIPLIEKSVCNNSNCKILKKKKKSFSHFSKYCYDAMNVLKRNQRINVQRSFQ